MSRSVLIATLLFATACGGESTSESTLGAVRIQASTTGHQLDPNGYAVSADGEGSATLPINGALSVGDLPAGDHLVALSGIAGNCHAPDSSLTATVAPQATDTVTFVVSCDTTYGRLRIHATTGGMQRDQDGYLISVNGTGSTPIGATDSVTLTDLPAGPSIIGLTGLAANCHAPATTDTASVPAGDIGSATFTITCDTTFGSIEVSAATTGGMPDPNGYLVQVSGVAHGSVAVSGSLLLDGFQPDTYVVTLAGLASNCHFAGQAADTVVVTSGTTVAAGFMVDCPIPGALTVDVTTTGAALDPDGYTVTIDSGAPTPIGVNGGIGPFSLEPGSHSVALRGIVMNCAVTGDSTRTAPLIAGDSLTVSFSVDCAVPTVAYSRGVTGESYAIWAMNPDGTNEVPIAPYATHGGGRAPYWSPDRQQVVYQTSGNDVSAGLSRVDADGSDHITIYDSAGALAPRWSAATDRILFIRRNPFAPLVTATGRVWAIDPDGGNPVQLLPDSLGAISADWSPTGDRVAIARFAPNGSGSGRVGIWVLTLATDSMVQVAPDTFNSGPVRWAPAGETIAFQCYDGVFALCTVNADGSSPTRLPLPELATGEFAWSPDGSRILWGSGNVHGGIDIVSWVVGAGTWTRLPSGTENRIDPAWH